MTTDRRGLAREVAARHGCLSRNLLVGISGFDAAGKTTLAAELVGELGGTRPVTVIEGDWFLNPREVRNANPDPIKAYYLESFDYARLVIDVIAPLRSLSQFDRQVRTLDLVTDTWHTVHLTVDAPTIVIVEGVFLFTKERKSLFDCRIWIDAPPSLCLTRALGRQRDWAHYGSAEAIKKRYLERLLPAQALHMERDSPALDAHIVLSASGS